MKKTATAFTTERRHLLEIIDGLIEGIILLDNNRHIAWANDTALAMHGVADLAGLGGTAAGYRKAYTLRYRNNRKLDAAQYPMDRALAGEAFKDMVVEVCSRRDPDFRRMHQVRNLVLNDAQGAVEGMVLVLLDVTERYSAEERFERTFNANPAPAVICSLADLRYVKVNQGFLEMTGYARQDVLDKTVRELDVLGDTPQREDALQRLAEGRTIPQTESCIAVQGGSKLVVVAGQPIEVAEQPCMLFTFNDLEPRRKAETALRHSEQRFATAFRLAPVPMTLSTAEGELLEVNDAFVATTGYDAATLSRDDALARLWTDPRAYDRAMASLEQGASVRSLEMALRTREGALLDCLLSAAPVKIQDLPCVLGAIQDITERKRNELELMEAIETVMQDTSWFSRTVIEAGADPRARRAAVAGRAGRPDAARARDPGPDLRRPHRRRDRGHAAPVAQHGAQSCGGAVRQAGRAPAQRRHHLARQRGIVGYEKPPRKRAKVGVARAGCSGAIHQTSRKVPVDLVRAFLTRARRHSYIGFVRGHGLQAARRAISPTGTQEQPHGQRPHQRRRQE